ncbi:MAG: transcriptional regulator GlxA family with amidase domain [Paraglaciecola sp.]|jgi:transcriptional regulator GlxA family with amidase domain
MQSDLIKLSDLVGQSLRFVEYNRFKQYLDISPMRYVTNWRMQSTRYMLAESALPIDSIAREVGYESAAAFSKAFKRMFAQNPGEYRRSVGT